MVVRLLNKIVNGDGEFPSGSILEIDDTEAERLVKLKAAVEIEDVLTEEEEDEEDGQVGTGEPLISLTRIPGIKDELIDSLNDADIYSVQGLAEKEIDELVMIKGIGAKTAERLLDAANELLED